MWFKKRNINDLKFKLKSKKVKELISIMLSEDTEISAAPISNEYFIIDKANQIFICVKKASIKISNHEYLYEIILPLAETEDIISTIRKEIQKRTELIKKELFKNEFDLIDKIKGLYDDQMAGN